ncbi:MAG: VOC family protein [Thermodesulfobacteriota bacterium]
MSVKPIPEGFNSVTPHLVVKGAAEAIEFYKKAFGAEEMVRLPGPDGNSLMHASLKIGNSVVMLVDEFPDMGCLSPNSTNGTPVTVHLYVHDVDSVFAKAIESGAKETMPLENTFWGDRFGKLEDPYGHSWSIATHIEDLTPDQIMENAAKAFGQQ